MSEDEKNFSEEGSVEDEDEYDENGKKVFFIFLKNILFFNFDIFLQILF